MSAFDILPAARCRAFLRRFGASERGAVTVDWIVLTAAMIGLCLFSYMAIETATLGLRDGVSDTIAGRIE